MSSSTLSASSSSLKQAMEVSVKMANSPMILQRAKRESRISCVADDADSELRRGEEEEKGEEVEEEELGERGVHSCVGGSILSFPTCLNPWLHICV